LDKSRRCKIPSRVQVEGRERSTGMHAGNKVKQTGKAGWPWSVSLFFLRSGQPLARFAFAFTTLLDWAHPSLLLPFPTLDPFPSTAYTSLLSSLPGTLSSQLIPEH